MFFLYLYNLFTSHTFVWVIWNFEFGFYLSLPCIIISGVELYVFLYLYNLFTSHTFVWVIWNFEFGFYLSLPCIIISGYEQ